MDEGLEQPNEKVRAAIQALAEVEQAVGVLMVRLECCQQEARETLTAMACVKGETVEQVAAALVAEVGGTQEGR